MSKQRSDSVTVVRSSVYGKFSTNAAVAQMIKLAISDGVTYRNLTPSMREALDLIASKISRIVTGDCKHLDNWVDISGYAQLIEQELSEK